MRRSFYFLIVGVIALIWLGNRMRGAFERLATGEPRQNALDMRYFGYSGDDARSYLFALGADKRKHYLRTQTLIEMPFILAYGVAGASAGVWLSAVIFAENWKLLSWLPFVGGMLLAATAVIDLDEANAIRKLIKVYPDVTNPLVARASKATRLKWAFAALGLALVLVGAVLAAIAKLKGA
jgi:hypothetical protein